LTFAEELLDVAGEISGEPFVEVTELLE